MSNMDFSLNFNAVDHTRNALRRLNRRLNAISRIANRINTALTDGSMRAAHAIVRMGQSSVRASMAMNRGLAETERRLTAISAASVNANRAAATATASVNTVNGRSRATNGRGNALGASVVAYGAFKALTSPIRQAKEYETAWIDVTKSVNGTNMQMDKLRDGLKSMNGMGFADLAEISASVGKMGIDIEDNLAFTRTIMMGSVALDMSAGEAAASMGKYLALTNQLDTAATSAAQAMDMIANAENSLANVTAAPLLDVLQRNASLSSQLGLDNQQSVALAAYISQTSTSAELGASEFKLAMNAFKKTDDKLGYFSKIKSGGISELTNIAKELSVATGAELIAAFGSEAATFIEKLVMPKNMAKLRTALNVTGDANGAALVEFNKYMASLDQMLAVVTKKLTNVAVTIGNILMPIVKALTVKITGVLTSVSAWLNNNKALSETIVTVAAGLLAFTLAAAGLGLVIMGLGVVMSTMGVAFSAVALLASPVAIAIAGIAGAIYLIYTNWDAAVSGIRTLMSDLKSYFIDMMLGITQSDAYKDFMSFIHMLGNFDPASAIGRGIDSLLGSGKELLFGDSGADSAINNTNPVNGEIKVVVESKDGTPVAGEVKSQDGVNLNLGLVYQ